MLGWAGRVGRAVLTFAWPRCFEKADDIVEAEVGRDIFVPEASDSESE